MTFSRTRIFFGLVLVVCVILAGSIVIRHYYRAWRASEAPKPQAPAEKQVTLVEGWNINQIAARCEEAGLWSRDKFLAAAAEDYSAQFDFLLGRPKNATLEGFLFPDTYRFYASSTPADGIAKLLENFDSKLSPTMRAEIKKQGKSIYEIVIMASIIEKEAPINNSESDNRDAKIISGIFWNRLRIGQGLQSDATLSYVLNDNKPAHSGAELETDSPFNTYKYRGLPPSPICNPGLVALEAAIYPEKTNYYYFLTAPDKSVYYAKTYEEHLRNKYKYLK